MKESRPLPLSRSTNSAEMSSCVTGREYLRTGTFVISAGFPCQDLSVAGKRTGLTGLQSSLMYDLIGWLSRTPITAGAPGCPNCGADSGSSGMPLCAFECEPQKLAHGMIEPAPSLLPTPTASSYGSCRGGGAGRVGKWRKSLDGLGIRHPEQLERMLGFPCGWTEITRLATPSALPSPNSLPAASSQSDNSGEQR